VTTTGEAGSGLVLVLNSGSSSVKFALLHPGSGERVLGGLAEEVGTPEAVLHVQREGGEPVTEKLTDGSYQAVIARPAHCPGPLTAQTQPAYRLLVVRYRVLVSGRVQGVFFRDTCRRLAQEHGVAGWVRNLPDGQVEAVFEGPAEDVDRLVAWAHHGPRHAVVDQVAVQAEPPEGLDTFRIT
jgi:acylphosphatase